MPIMIPATIAMKVLFCGKMPNLPIAPVPTSADAATTDPHEAIDPIEMSIAPAIATTVSPIASKPTITIACARLFIRFCQVKNFDPPVSPTQLLATVMKNIRRNNAKSKERLSVPKKSKKRRKMFFWEAVLDWV